MILGRWPLGFLPLGSEVAGLSASVVQTEADDTIASTATVLVSAVVVQTEADDTIASTATVLASAVVVQTEDDDTIASIATVLASADFTETEGDDTLTAVLSGPAVDLSGTGGRRPRVLRPDPAPPRLVTVIHAEQSAPDAAGLLIAGFGVFAAQSAPDIAAIGAVALVGTARSAQCVAGRARMSLWLNGGARMSFPRVAGAGNGGIMLPSSAPVMPVLPVTCESIAIEWDIDMLEVIE